MHGRFRASAGAALVVSAATLFAQLPQSSPAVALAKAGELDGVWAFSTLTPLERTAEFSGKPALTPEEAAAFEKRTVERNDRDRRDGASPDADLGGAYNEFWWERGTRVANVPRTDEVEGLRTARLEAKQRIEQRGAVYHTLRALTWVMKLDVALFGRVESGPFFALLAKE